MKHVVIGTAGHIDHGKSALVQALTGTDPDRLQEEKARGITIELGFAHTTEDGVALSFVDVPGHERFVRNMLGGVGGMDIMMLHVAADESIKPQTREHFEICRLLRVTAGLVVITKSDLADPATLDVVRLETKDLIAGSFLESAPILAVSARTGAGLPELRRTLATLARSAGARAGDGPPRLPIDRVFSMKGFGTVVTGTLIVGQLSVDDEIVLQPSGVTAKIRGLHVHGEGRPEVAAGQRVAVNLTGVEVAEISRGETLTHADAVTVTRRADVRVELLGSAKPLRHGARVRFHQGTRELLARIVLAGPPEAEPGESVLARLHLEAPAALVRGDRFILRAYSPLATIGGGTVLDPLPSRKGVRTPAAIARLERLSDPDIHAQTALMVMIEEAGLRGLPMTALAGRAGVPWSDQDRVVGELARSSVVRIGNVLVAASYFAAAEEAMRAAVAQHHDRHPLEAGIPREELRERLFGHAPVAVFEEAVRRGIDRGHIVGGDRIALAGRSIALTDEEARTREGIVRILNEAGLTPPDLTALATLVDAAPEAITRIANLLVRQHVLVRTGGLLFHEIPLSQLKSDIRSLKQAATTATMDVATFKQRYSVTRKYAIPLLEWLDRERVTRRVGDVRHIL
jgi:selenocysteine-specific elongation factor